MTARPSREIAREVKQGCKYCRSGHEIRLIDKDGTQCSISKLPGTFCHAVDDYWWPCADISAALDQARREALEEGIEWAANRLEKSDVQEFGIANKIRRLAELRALAARSEKEKTKGE